MPIELATADAVYLGTVAADVVYLGSTTAWTGGAPPEPIGPAFVKETNGSVDVAATSWQMAVTSTAGNALIALMTSSAGATGSVTGLTDTAGNTWIEHEDLGASGVSNTHLAFWYCLGAASPGTITVASSNHSWQWQVVEFDEVATSGQPEDAPSAIVGTSSAAPAAPAVTTQQAGGSLVVAMIAYGSTPTATLTSSGWTAFTNPPASGNKHLRSAWTVTPAAGTHQATWSLSSAQVYTAASLALKWSGAGIGSASLVGPSTLIGP